jgi:hypothetical protein
MTAFVCWQLVRCWGHINGFGTIQRTQYPIQPRLGQYNEATLQRYDLVLNELSKVCNGTRCLEQAAWCSSVTTNVHWLSCSDNRC